jgi:hypothetical protein
LKDPAFLGTRMPLGALKIPLEAHEVRKVIAKNIKIKPIFFFITTSFLKL